MSSDNDGAKVDYDVSNETLAEKLTPEIFQMIDDFIQSQGGDMNSYTLDAFVVYPTDGDEKFEIILKSPDAEQIVSIQITKFLEPILEIDDDGEEQEALADIEFNILEAN